MNDGWHDVAERMIFSKLRHNIKNVIHWHHLLNIENLDKRFVSQTIASHDKVIFTRAEDYR